MKKSNFSKILALCCAGHLFINILLTIFLLVVSSKNYPGGYAISRLHSAENASLKSVHISNLVAQTGFTRFFQHKDWTYNKTENLKYNESTILQFDYLMVESNSHKPEEALILNKYFYRIDQIECFQKLSLQYRKLKPLTIKTHPCVDILKRKTKKENYINFKSLPLENSNGVKNLKTLKKIIKDYINNQ